MPFRVFIVRLLLAACLAVSAAPVAVIGQTVSLVVPNSHALVGGDINNALPFSYGGMSLRYQQVYEASQFSALRPGGGTISHIRFRYHQRNNEVSIRYQLVVKLSTTTRAVNGLSTDLPSNFGPDTKTVYNSPFFVVYPPSSVGEPWPFGLTIPFASGFFYNPANGNLLVEMYVWQYYTWHAGPLLDTVTAAYDSVSRVYRDAQNYYGSTPDTLGLVTEFGVTPVLPLQPRITLASISNNDFILQGSGGASGLVYCVLTSTNLSLAATNWVCTATNTFDATGNFIVTNAPGPDRSQQFYQIQIQ